MDRQGTLHSTAIVPAAGQGVRMGTARRKQFLSLGGEPVLVHALRMLQRCPEIEAIVLVVPEEDRAFCEERIAGHYGLDKVAAIIPGGKERQDSVYAGLLALAPVPEVVLIHDGVRPFADPEMVCKTIGQAAAGISAVVGVPVSDTIKSVDAGGRVIKTLQREGLWSIQTPQAFPCADLLKAYDKAYREGLYGTDDATLIEGMGLPVKVLMGSSENIKITSLKDMVLAEAILERRNNRMSWTPGKHESPLAPDGRGHA